MKFIKLILLGLTAIFAFISSSKAGIGITTNYSKLTISLTVTTNAPDTYKSGVYTYTTVTVKLANSDLLAWFASWDKQTWPTGAQLVEGWDNPWKGDILVADKTGTNVLFDATTWSDSLDRHFTLNFYNQEGAYTATENENKPGFYDFTWGNNGSFELYDDVNETYISGTGPCTEIFSQKWDKNGDFTTWSDSESFSAAGAGPGELFKDTKRATVVAGITAKGNGSGENYIYELY